MKRLVGQSMVGCEEIVYAHIWINSILTDLTREIKWESTKDLYSNYNSILQLDLYVRRRKMD
jgi:hypothetical protein